MSSSNPNVNPFDKDASERGGYEYTLTDRLSCQMATGRTKEIILETNLFAGRRVMDLGCGDGFFTTYIYDHGKPKSMVGIDGAANAIAMADTRKGARAIEYKTSDAHHVDFPDSSFDLVLIQSILHHDDTPWDMIREGFRLAPRILIHEPNGNNPLLKIVEKTSKYHIEHGEKSYRPSLVASWIRSTGGRVTHLKYAGFVPMFSPDPMARAMKFVEPVIETVPGLRQTMSSVFVMVGERNAA